ncbi:1,3-beta-glucanosyltransferase [Dimargaris verticillata]|uniref:1,3-beta-glucanosyltransferase n=1 Tax=Dimargaris verticillata TaxID=2761393 RepID=A0A9W8B6H5_9FUNG|nr:1,3-beta-glucanosyltransferase [Dimargaris verticillata]
MRWNHWLTVSVVGLAVLQSPWSVIAGQLTIQGNRFFDAKSKEQYYIKGLIYQPNRTDERPWPDPLADSDACERDVTYFQDLGVNTIRVYETNNTADHTDCMQMLEDAGINVFLDLKAVDTNNPSYDSDLLTDFVDKIEAFRSFSNFVGVFAGNQVVTNNETTLAAVYNKALIRDVKAYITAQNLELVVGYADGSNPQTAENMLKYLNCGKKDDRVDFFAVNLHSWCGEDANFENSGFKDAIANMTDLNFPMVLGEFGCDQERPQSFGEVGALFGKEMVEVFSGGFASEYSEEGKNKTYGLVKIKARGVKTLDEFDILAEAYDNVKPKTVKFDEVKGSRKTSACPRVGPGWQSGQVLPKKPSPEACACLMDSFTCRIDLNSEEEPDLEDWQSAYEDLCPPRKCSEVFDDAANNIFGSWSMCPLDVKLSYALNRNYTSSKNNDEKKCKARHVETEEVKNPKTSNAKTCLKLRKDFVKEEKKEDSSTASGLSHELQYQSWKGWVAMTFAIAFAAFVF